MMTYIAAEIIGRWNVIFRLDKVLKERKALQSKVFLCIHSLEVGFSSFLEFLPYFLLFTVIVFSFLSGHVT